MTLPIGVDHEGALLSLSDGTYRIFKDGGWVFTELSAGEAIAALDAIDGGDPEAAHATADDIVLSLASTDVVEAYARVVERCRWWAWA